MGREPKAKGGKGAKADPAQVERFKEAARRIGADETGEAFERAFEKIAKSRRTGPSRGKRSEPAPEDR